MLMCTGPVHIKNLNIGDCYKEFFKATYMTHPTVLQLNNYLSINKHLVLIK